MADAWIYHSSPSSPIDQSGAGRTRTSPSSGASPDTRPHAPRIRRRNRVITSCLQCRRRKLKCDKQAPCTNCTRFRRDCLYLAPSLDPQSQQKLADIKEKMGSLEKTLERNVARKPPGAHITTQATAAAEKLVDSEDEDASEAEDEKGLEPTPLASLDSVYEAGADDEFIDLGVQLGKMRISERVGGWIRPKFVEELSAALKGVRAGPSSWSEGQSADHSVAEAPVPASMSAHMSYLGPGPDYIAPASSFFFPGTLSNSTLIDLLPSKPVSDQLMAQYYAAVHPLCRCVHRPSCDAQYSAFWAQISVGNEPPPPVQAIMFAAMFSAAISMSEQQIMQAFGVPRNSLVASLQLGTEMALSRANFLRTTKVDTMQAFVMYLIPLCRAEVSRAHSALTGTAIRLAECLGLHRDGTNYGLSAVDTHVRRIIWYQLCFLDMRTCEATGPRPQIRKQDYDTKFPLNVNDMDLMSFSPPTEDSKQWTDMTFSRMRMECIGVHRQLWSDVPRIDRKKITLTSCLGKVQTFRKSFEAWFYPIIDETVPINMLAKHVYLVYANRTYVQILHPYLLSVATKLPDRLRQILIEGALEQNEHAFIVETKPEFSTWAWYRGAYQQHHSGLLLLIELYAYPMRKEATRIWKCLDWIFDIPPNLNRKQKAEMVLSDLRDRCDLYQQLRKIKATTQMEEHLVVPHWRHGSTEYNDAMPQPTSYAGTLDFNPATDGAFGNMPIQSPSPLALAGTDSSESPQASNQGSVGKDIELQMQTLNDIDWAEWDQYFSPETNTGDLNMPDFNVADSTSGAPMEGFEMPQAADLADMSFTPALIPQQFYDPLL